MLLTTLSQASPFVYQPAVNERQQFRDLLHLEMSAQEEEDSSVHVSARAAAVESFKVMDVLQRANELQAMGRDVLHCEVGQPETGAPKHVAQAAVDALTEPQVMGYTDAFGLLELRQKIAQYYKKKYNVQDLSERRIVMTTGSSGGFLLAFTACFDPLRYYRDC